LADFNLPVDETSAGPLLSIALWPRLEKHCARSVQGRAMRNQDAGFDHQYRKLLARRRRDEKAALIDLLVEERARIGLRLSVLQIGKP